MPPTHESAGLYLVGDVYVDPFDDDGNPTGELGPLNAQSVAIGRPAPEAAERISKMKDTDGQLLDGVYSGKPSEIDIEIDDAPGEIMAMIFNGNASDVTEGSGTATDEPVSLIPGRWTKLAHRNLAESGINLAKTSAPTVALAEGTDYEINHAMGMVKAIVGGAVSAVTPGLIDYSHGAVSGTKVTSDVRPYVKARIRVDGKNKTNGKAAQTLVHEALLWNTGKTNFTKGEYAAARMSGKLRTPPGKTEPYTYEELILA